MRYRLGFALKSYIYPRQPRFQDFYFVSDPIGAKETINIYNNEINCIDTHNNSEIVKQTWMVTLIFTVDEITVDE